MSPTTMATVYAGGHTKRMHTRITVSEQTVAQHSFGVAWWCWVLSNKAPSVNLIMAALAHDVPEYQTGDIPSHVKGKIIDTEQLNFMEADVYAKADMPVFELTEEEQRILKIADYADLLAYCRLEQNLGNRTPSLQVMSTNVAAMLHKLLQNDPLTESFIWRGIKLAYGEERL